MCQQHDIRMMYQTDKQNIMCYVFCWLKMSVKYHQHVYICLACTMLWHRYLIPPQRYLILPQKDTNTDETFKPGIVIRPIQFQLYSLVYSVLSLPV